MKNKFLFIAVFVLFLSAFISESSYAQAFKLKPGSKLVYEVNFPSEKYDFIIVLNVFSDSIFFNFSMTNANRTAGTAVIQALPLQNSFKMYNYFHSDNMIFINETAIWISKDAYNAFANNGKAEMESVNDYKKLLNVDDKISAYNAKINGEDKTLEIFYADGNDAKEPFKLWVLKDPTNPLIVKMDLGWTVHLKEIIE